MQKKSYFEEDPQWYKDAIIYQLHVKTFYDSNGDGIGDFPGLTQKLDYLEDLGINTIWLLPFYPSPLRDDGYDIADYREINPSYGTIKDFKIFLAEAHKRNLKVITELVINHTSDQHPWFQRARRAKKGSAARDYYMWNDSPDKYRDARIIFQDFETSNWAWDSVAQAYYWHRFYSHQPDLNFDNPQVHKEIFKITDFWFSMGVDGVRLDAIPYLYAREGTNCENLPETHVFLKKLRAYIDSKYKDKMVLAEANQWPEDSVAYFGEGDECNMAFHFPIMPRMYMSLQMEDRFPLIDIIEQTPQIPDNCQWAIFLRNHDELTLEMVTDEERDYMYRVYAKDPKARINLGIRRRLAPLMENSKRKIELMNSMLFSFPGSPIIYYGDEIGMGDNYYLGDRNGVRTPMQWSPDKNAGFSRANPQELYLPVIIEPTYHYEAVNVENYQKNPSSLLWWMKRIITMRKKYKAFGRGSIDFILTDNAKILSYIRKYQDEIILVVVNLSKFSQPVEIDLSPYSGYIPEEIFSRNKFPLIKETPYTLTLGRYETLFFLLNKKESPIVIESRPGINVKSNWSALSFSQQNKLLENKILPDYLPRCTWFNKNKKINKIDIIDSVIISEDPDLRLLIFDVSYIEETPDTFMLALSTTSKAVFETVKEDLPNEALITVVNPGDENNAEIIYDGLYNGTIRKVFLNAVLNRKIVKTDNGEINFEINSQIKKKLKNITSTSILRSQHCNSLLNYDNTAFFKIYRRLETGTNPDTEILQFLNLKKFKNVPNVMGTIEYKRQKKDVTILTMIQNYLPNSGDAWNFSLEAARRFFTELESNKKMFDNPPNVDFSRMEITQSEISPDLQEMFGIFFLEMITLLGKRTGQMHLALASDLMSHSFRPDDFSMLYQRSVYQSIRSLVKKTTLNLKKERNKLNEDITEIIDELMDLEEYIINFLSKTLNTKKIIATKIRIHGDFYLKQILFTGKDFEIIDFEGEASKALSERKLKRSPFRDVANIIRSLSYVVYTALMELEGVKIKNEMFNRWADIWFFHMSGIFLNSYFETVRDASFVPDNVDDLENLLKVFLVERTFTEIRYELEKNSDGLIIPVKGFEYLKKYHI